MPDNIADIAAALTAERMGAPDAQPKAASAQPTERLFEKVFETLMDLLNSESDTARLGAAKAIFDRMTSKEDDDARRREAEERATAIAEARCLLAELAAAPFAGADQPAALAEDGAGGATDAAAAPVGG